MADWRDILSDDNNQLSEEELLKYLDDKTPEGERLAIEKKIADTPFERDALEGLSQIRAEKVQTNVKLLNLKLRQQLLAKKSRQEKGKIRDFRWIILAILILLLICILSYLIIRMHNGSGEHHSTLIQSLNNNCLSGTSCIRTINSIVKKNLITTTRFTV